MRNTRYTHPAARVRQPSNPLRQAAKTLLPSPLQAAANASNTVKSLTALQEHADRSRQTPATPQPSEMRVPPDLRKGIETLSGVSMDSVKVHRNSPRPAQLKAFAYAQGRDIHLGPGQEKHLPHEAWHIVQQAKGQVHATTSENGQPVNDDARLEREAQKMGARALSPQMASSPLRSLQRVPNGSAPVQRVYAGLTGMQKARVDQQADADYANKALAFELGMAQRIMTNPAVHAAIDGMLLNVKTIVDAWAEHTSQEKAAVYEHEFGWPPGDEFYGAFEMTAENITAVFQDTNKPLRTKLKLIYNAVRNNALSKWLKVAALQLDKKARGKSKQQIKVRSQGFRVDRSGPVEKRIAETKNENVSKGFAEASGIEALHDQAATTGLIKTAKEKNERTRKRVGVRRTKRDMFGHGNFSKVVGWQPATVKANQERFHDPSAEVPANQQRHLKVADVPDLTDEEIDLMIKRRTTGVATHITSGSRDMFKQQAASDLSWSQGREYYDIDLDSDSAKEAAQIKARLESGISGSTDLMMHAGEHLGITNNNQKMPLRLALAGWMIAARDHSFYEVFKAAEAYGLPFNIDPTRPGAEYEETGNLNPMKRDDFAGILPNDGPLVNVFPAQYLSTEWKDHLEATLGDPNRDETAVKAGLVASGVNKLSLSAMNERDTVAIERLERVVQAKQIDPTAATSLKRQMVRQIKEDPAYLYLADTFGSERARRTLSDLLAHHHQTAGLADQGTVALLRNIGLPDVVIDFATPNDIYRLDQIRQAVGRLATPAQGPIDPTPFIHYLTVTTPMQTLDLPRIKMVVAAMIRWYHPTVQQTVEDTHAADEMNRIRELEQIINMETTTGTWYSWGPPGSHNYHILATSLREATAANTSSDQGPGLYVANTVTGSSSYGKDTGRRVMVLTLKNVATVNQNNPEQRDRLDRLLGYGVAPLQKSGLYYSKIRAEFLMRYGSGNFARLTTNKGVRMSMDLKEAPADDLKKHFKQHGRWTGESRQNFIAQAAESNLDISSW